MSGSIRKDPAWKYSCEIEVPPSKDGSKKGYKYLKCNFCNKEFKGGVKRMKEHLACTRKNAAACTILMPNDVKSEIIAYMKEFERTKHAAQQTMEEMVDSGSYFSNHSRATTPVETLNTRSVRGPMDHFMVNNGDDEKNELIEDLDDSKTTQMTPTSAKEMRNQVCLDIGRFFFENGIPFNAVRSPSFINMCRSLGNYGRGFKPPSMHELRNWILDEEEKTTSTIVDGIKDTWKQTGVSILSDGWSDMRNRSLINFLVNNPHGTVFLKSVDASDCVKDAQKLFELLDEIVEEVGEDNVIRWSLIMQVHTRQRDVC